VKGEGMKNRPLGVSIIVFIFALLFIDRLVVLFTNISQAHTVLRVLFNELLLAIGIFSILKKKPWAIIFILLFFAYQIIWFFNVFLNSASAMLPVKIIGYIAFYLAAGYYLTRPKVREWFKA